jgi:hypothetical protein
VIDLIDLIVLEIVSYAGTLPGNGTPCPETGGKGFEANEVAL